MFGNCCEPFGEPVVGQLGRFLERAWFFEQVRGTWDSYKACPATEILHGLAIEVDDEGIASADDEKHWLAYLWQVLPSEVGPTAAADDGPDSSREYRRGDEC